MYGEPLPPNIIAQPTTSFDQDGYFIGIVKPPAVPTSGELKNVEVKKIVTSLHKRVIYYN